MTEMSATTTTAGTSTSHKKQSNNAGLNSWSVTKTVGGKFTGVNPLFTTDKSHFIVLTSLEVRVYLLSTRQCVRSVAIDTSNVTDMSIMGGDNERILLSRSTGECVVVNWQERQVERTIEVGTPIRKIITVLSDDKFLFLSEHNHELQLIRHDTQNGNQIITQRKNGRLFAISNSGKYFAFYSYHKKTEYITAGQLADDSESLVRERTFKRSRPVLSLAVSDDGLVAVGSTTGVVDLYYECFTATESEPAMRALKWHVDSVLTLSFSLDGDYLLSGGKEKVLVFWQLDTDNTQFLPRLGGEVRNIIVDPSSELYALTLGGDEVLVLSAVDLISRLQVSGVKANFTKLPNDPEKERKRRKKNGNDDENDRVGDFTAQFYIDPKTKNGYFPTKSSSQIQIYDIAKDEQDSVFTVASTIQTGKVRKEELIEDPQVNQVAFTYDGRWMATVDETMSPAIDGLLSKDDKEVSLKFWHRNEKSGKWELATRVASPHGANKSVLDIIPADQSYHNGHAFVSAANDGGVRLWRPSTINEIGNNKAGPRTVAWSVRKILPPGSMTSSAVALTWSEDSSVIILGFETSTYVIDASNFMVHRIMPNILASRVRSLKIVGNYLVALSKTRLVVWNLLNDSQLWSVYVQAPQGGRRLIAYDNSSQRIALAVNYFTKDYKVESKTYIFDVTSPMPIHIESHNQGISAVNLVPGTHSFNILDVNARISTLELRGVSTTTDHTKQDFSSEITHLYNLKQHAKIVPEVVDEDEDNLQVLNVNSFDKVFDGSAEYSLDSLETLFDKVLGVISPRRK
ncbi:hypothetical protein TRICI_001541 [Trichomonascus ciferrii]|uniref:WD repeat-containing protein 75 second beta-propeller domain-containing protein n=1 Tax=Trichomonascus ciferrii TaxID=44093 RepID=A0A642V992_9ASCO|nr:hypothetical protein TRICI_001541 [Trichomonascus ciferrii]